MAHFVKQEEENFALFNYVNELNDEMECLQTRMTELTLAIEEARTLHEYRERQQVETLKNITEQLEEQTRLADEAEEELNDVRKLMKRKRLYEPSIFFSFFCSFLVRRRDRENVDGYRGALQGRQM